MFHVFFFSSLLLYFLVINWHRQRSSYVLCFECFFPWLLHLTAKTRATSQFRVFSSLLSDYVNWHHRAISQRFAFPMFLFCVQIIRFPECVSRFLIWSFWFMIAANTRAILQRFAFFSLYLLGVSPRIAAKTRSVSRFGCGRFGLLS